MIIGKKQTLRLFSSLIRINRMKFLLICFLACCTVNQINAQPGRLDTSRRVYADTLTAIEQKLVELAWNSPEAQQVDHQNKINEYQLKAAKNTWMNLLSISGSFNDQQLTKQPNTTVVYPRVFLGVTVPIGTLFSRTQVKAARESIEMGKLTKEETRRRIKADVLGKYKQYIAQGQILSIETGVFNDLQAVFQQAEDNFRKNSISFELYNTALRNKNDQQSKVIQLRLQQDLTKLEIERMIGTSLESVIRGN